MVVSLTVLLKSLKTLTISSHIPYEIGDTLTLELSNTTYFFEVIYRCQTIKDGFLYTLKPTFNSNFQML